MCTKIKQDQQRRSWLKMNGITFVLTFFALFHHPSANAIISEISVIPEALKATVKSKKCLKTSISHPLNGYDGTLHFSFLPKIRGGATSTPPQDQDSSINLDMKNSSTVDLNDTRIDSSKEKSKETLTLERHEIQRSEPEKEMQEEEQNGIGSEDDKDSPLFDADSTTDTEIEAEIESNTESDEVKIPEPAEETSTVDPSEIIITTTTVPSEMDPINYSSSTTEASTPPTSTTLSLKDVEALRDQASKLRSDGKKFHNDGDLEKAATFFDDAATILEKIYSNVSSIKEKDEQNFDMDFFSEISQEAATCRLHQALCALKNKEYQTCINICSFLLDDEDDVDKKLVNKILDSDLETESIITTPTSQSSSKPFLLPAIRARAHLRRAKARLELSNDEEALEDARTAAFLGDRGAVALYGRLMREKGSGYGLGMGLGMNGEGMGSPNDALESLFGNTGASGSLENPLESLSAALLSGGSNFGGGGGGGGGGLGSLASMLSPKSSKNPNSFIKQTLSAIQSPETQSIICSFLNSVTESKVSSFASTTNISLSKKQISQIVKFSNSMTVSKIQKSMKLTKRGISAFKTMRKVTKVIGKYKYLLVYLMVIQWVKSAVNRPIVLKLKKK